MDDAPAYGRAHRPMPRSRMFRLVALAFTATMVGTTLPTPLYPIYQEQFHVSKLMSTVIYATYAVGVITALMLFGRLSDEIGRRWVLLVGLRFSAASAVTFLVAENIGTLLAGRALSGLSAGLVAGTATAALVDLDPEQRPGRASLVAAAANMGGLALGPLLAGTLAEFAPQPVRLCFIVNLILIGIAVIGVELMPEPRRYLDEARSRPRPRRRPRRGPRARRWMGALASWVRYRSRLRVQRLHVPPETRGAFIRAGAAGFAGFAVLGLFTAISGPLLAAVVDRPGHLLAGLLAFAGFAASLVGQALSTSLTERRGLLCGCAVLLVAMALVVTSLTVASLPLLVAAAIAAGIGQGMSLRAGLAMLTAASPTGQRATVASSYFMVVYIALSIPVIGVGAGAQAVGWARAAVVFAALVGLFPLVALVALARPERVRPPRELPAGSTRLALPAASPAASSATASSVSAPPVAALPVAALPATPQVSAAALPSAQRATVSSVSSIASVSSAPANGTRRRLVPPKLPRLPDPAARPRPAVGRQPEPASRPRPAVARQPEPLPALPPAPPLTSAHPMEPTATGATTSGPTATGATTSGATASGENRRSVPVPVSPWRLPPRSIAESGQAGPWQTPLRARGPHTPVPNDPRPSAARPVPLSAAPLPVAPQRPMPLPAVPDQPAAQPATPGPVDQGTDQPVGHLRRQPGT